MCVFLVVAAAAWALTATGYPQALWLHWVLVAIALTQAAVRVRDLKMRADAARALQAPRVES